MKERRVLMAEFSREAAASAWKLAEVCARETGYRVEAFQSTDTGAMVLYLVIPVEEEAARKEA